MQFFKMPIGNFMQVNIGDCNFQVPVHRYTIESIIGGGSYGIVIKAIDNMTGKHVAIKRLKHPFNHPETARRAYREFELLQIVNHKNVVQLLNAYTPQSKHSDFEEVYFVMEYMDYPLRAVIHKRKTQFQGLNGGRQMSFLIYQLLCGVNHLHQAKIAHRDLTPDNVMVDSKFQLKIVDLGLASQLDSNNDRSAYVTMRFYRAPEVVLSVKYDHKVDVWSIGCIFAELLTGSILCPGRDKYDQWTQIVKVVGTPDENFTSRLDVQLQEYIHSYPRYEATPWESICSDFFFPMNDRPFCSAQNGRDLLSRMLVIDPYRRISAEEALKHPYVSWKNHPDEISSPPRGQYDSKFESKTTNWTTEEWRKKIFDKIKNYENKFKSYEKKSLIKNNINFL